MNKTKLKQRLIDICNGAGYVYLEDDEYFQPEEDTLINVGNAIQAIERAFDLGSDTRLRSPWELKRFGSPDELVELVQEAIECDTEQPQQD